MAVKKENKQDTINRLRKDILRCQGFMPVEGQAERIGLGPLEGAFPHGVFPAHGVHEFISTCWEDSAATNGFMAGLLSWLMAAGGVCLWISTVRALFPPSVVTYGVQADRIVFVDMKRERDVLWAMEESLKCAGLAAVVAEVQEMDFAQSRRLQLAIEKSRVTGLVLRSNPRFVGSTACVARWRIRPLPSTVEDGLPGVGFPRWEAKLLKVRNGNPGCWQMGWAKGRFVPVMPAAQPKGKSIQLKKIS